MFRDFFNHSAAERTGSQDSQWRLKLLPAGPGEERNSACLDYPLGCVQLAMEGFLDMVVISASVRERLLDLTTRAWPCEACAALLGKRLAQSFLISDVRPLTNVCPSSVSFAVTEKDLVRALDGSPGPMAGLFHSHSGSVHPSRRDLAAMASTRCLWLIGTVRQLVLHLEAFVWRDGRVHVVPVREGS